MAESEEVPVGRRESSKRATRRALQEAANRLFEERGYATTTVRDIAAVAGVTERTFFRYFGSKEELLADRVLTVLPVLRAAIAGRPDDESPVAAAHAAFSELLAPSRSRSTPSTATEFFAQGPPGLRIRNAGPALLLTFEAGIADEFRSRMARVDPAAHQRDLDYQAAVLAALVMAVVRSALIRESQLRSDGGDQRHLADLVADGFALLGPLCGERASPRPGPEQRGEGR
ncbi:TetR family transcriptional regulator [soil metagenome]